MAKSLLRSFAGGEITPEMFGRIDLSKFQTGLRFCRNFRVLPHGPAARRQGTMFLNEARDSTRQVRLIPFVFSATQALILEFGHQYVRFHGANGTVLETASAIQAVSTGNPAIFTQTAHGYSNGDWIYLVGPPAWPGLSNRFFVVANVTANTYTLTDQAGAAVSTVGLPAYIPGGITGATAARVYTLVSAYAESVLFSLHYAQSNDVLTITQPGGVMRELRRLGATNWQFTDVNFAVTLPAPTGVTATATSPTPTNPTQQVYVVTSVAADLVTESLASTQASATNNLTIAGNFNTITWSAAAGAVRYYVYKRRGGVFGYIGQTTTLSLIDDNITPDTLTTPPENTITLNTGTLVNGLSDYPAAVVYHERRRWMAGTPAQPQNLWATRNATESNLTASIPSRDDDAMAFRIASNQQHTIRHLLSLTDLVALTVGGEFRIYADGQPAITPTSISIRQQASNGAADVQPAMAANSALYVQSQGSYIRELAFDPAGTGAYRINDVSIMAPHLFDGYTIREVAYCRAPDATFWAVRSDGVLLGMTYVPEQQVYGWHHHDTDGFVESVAVIPENNRDTLYLLVRRTVNGRSVRYIERLVPRLFIDQEDAYFVDCGLTYSGTAASTIYGLWHLEGKSVQILADGAEVTDKVVTNGSITLDDPASVVHVGLGYTSQLITLPAAYEGVEAAGQGTSKNVTDVYLRVNQSVLVKAGPALDNLVDFPAREVSQNFGTPPAIRTAELHIPLPPDWNQDGSVCIQQDGPFPLTVAAIAVATETGG